MTGQLLKRSVRTMGNTMAYSPTQLKAIDAYQRAEDCIVQLSVYPNIRFKKREDGTFFEVHLNTIMNRYKTNKKEEAAERSRAKKEADRGNKTRKFF